MSIFLRIASGLAVVTLGASASFGEGKRVPAVASAERSAAGHGPELAVDGNADSLWVASLKAGPENNEIWFQLDLGRVTPVARLHWIAARGKPYPAAAPSVYRVLVSDDGSAWTPVPLSTAKSGVEPDGDVLLNVDARYVRLATTKIFDGTGWSLGLHEVWVTGGREFRPRVEARDGAIRLTWAVPHGLNAVAVNLYRGDTPRARAPKPLARLGVGVGEFLDPVPNWAPQYYRLEAVDAQGKSILMSTLAAGIARPVARATAPVETFAFWYEPYKPSTGPDPSIKRIGDAGFLIGPGSEVTADLATLGKGLLPYVTYYQTSGWVGSFARDADPRKVRDAIAPVAFFASRLRFPGSPPGYAPSVFCRPGNVEYDPAAVQYTTCPNSAALRGLALAHARRQLAGGVLGFFVDNGYDDDVASRAVCESKSHEHFYGDGLTSADAFLGLLLEVSCAVKSLHPNGVVMVNGGVPAHSEFYGLSLGDVCDGQLWESYLRSSYNTPKEHVADWHHVYRRSLALEEGAHSTPPRRTFVLSYPWDRDEAFFCYATAKLCHLPWSASLGDSDPGHRQFGGHFGTYPELVGLRLGLPTRTGQFGGFQRGDVYAREYERGMVIVNPAKAARTVSIPLGRVRRFREIYSGREEEGESIATQLPGESGRVYLWREIQLEKGARKRKGGLR